MQNCSFVRLSKFKIDFSSCLHQNFQKRILLYVPTFSWGNWICNQISKNFILKLCFYDTFCEFWRSRIKPRIVKIVFFFLHHGSRWTFWQYGAVLCFLARKVLGKNGSNIGLCRPYPTMDRMKFLKFTCLNIEQNHTSSCSLPILTYESILGFS